MSGEEAAVWGGVSGFVTVGSGQTERLSFEGCPNG